MPATVLGRQIFAVKLEDRGRLSDRAKRTRHSHMDPARVDVTQIMQVERRFVAEYAADLERPKSRFEVLEASRAEPEKPASPRRVGPDASATIPIARVVAQPYESDAPDGSERGTLRWLPNADVQPEIVL